MITCALSNIIVGASIVSLSPNLKRRIYVCINYDFFLTKFFAFSVRLSAHENKTKGIRNNKNFMNFIL